jgi:propanol-preferring alcohol dehydrogenase
MRAMVLPEAGVGLELRSLAVPEPRRGEVLIAVEACGVCRTDLHIVDGELPDIPYPVVPGHQIVGRVVAVGEGVERPVAGERVGVPWLGWTCGECSACRAGRENLCARAEFTGFHRQGGFAELLTADAAYCFALAEDSAAVDVAPLLCGGLIGYRALRLAGDATTIGLYGFGSAAHILAQVLRHQGRTFHVFTRPGDSAGQSFARELGAAWAGGSDESAPEPLDAALIFAPVGALVPKALRDVRPGGSVVCGGIHMSDIPSFPYAILWGERCIRSVANLTRRDGEELLALAAEVPIRVRSHAFPLEEAERALDDLRHGRFEGSAVLVP